MGLIFKKDKIISMMKRFRILFFIFFVLSGVFLTRAQTFTKSPYLANPGEHTITIRWESDVKAGFSVNYGNSKTFGKSVSGKLIGFKKSGYLYEANISKLKTGKTNFYQVQSENIFSDIHKFKAGVKSNHPFSFVVLGDSRSKPHVFSAIAKQVNEIDPALIVANGDLIAKGGDFDHWQTQFFDAAKDMIDHIPFIAAVGDHESDEVDGDEAILFTHYLFPEKDHLKLWYSYDVGDAHFIFLDWRYPFSEEMIMWFKEDVKKSDKPWKFVIMHRPTYNLGGHRVAWGKDVWPELFRENKIDIVFAGHSHLYERFYPLRPMSKPDAWPVTYITTGGAGASLYEAIENPSIAYTRSINHFLKVDIHKNNISLKAIGIDGEVLDSISWEKKKGNLNAEYLKLVKPQEEMDIVNVFNGPISQRMERLPMVEVPYQPVLKLRSGKVKEDIEFTIRLADASKGNYEMESVTGILKAGEQLDLKLKIYGKSTLTVSKWGDLKPELRLLTDYKTRSFNGTIIGKLLEYIAW
jgi:predicted phosphodiesterase